MSENKIDCEQHGTSSYCIICRHLREQNGLGYFAIQAELTEPGQAWCEECDQVFIQECGWNDLADNQADWTLYCARCYEIALESHELLSWIEGTSPDDE